MEFLEGGCLIQELYDLDSLVGLICRNSMKSVALQFPDCDLDLSVCVYQYLLDSFEQLDQNGENNYVDNINLYIIADSTWGSSVDDVSAMHINADLVVYFGSDLSSSGSIPVVVIPKKIKINPISFVSTLQSEIFGNEDFKNISKLILFYEAGVHFLLNEIKINLKNLEVVIAELPDYFDPSSWKPSLKSSFSNFDSNNFMNIGGLYLHKKHLENYQDENCLIVYIGDKSEQLTSILLKLSTHRIVSYSPKKLSLNCLVGTETIEFRERYGGVSRVEDAKIIGIIIGSMGLTGALIQNVLDRLQTLILASKKKYYTFVMGRLNEYKISNFPEVDVFCLIANDDNANIKPKTFPTPVITPYELEVGLGAREWDSTYTNDLNFLVGNGASDLSNAVKLVSEKFEFDEIAEEIWEGVSGTKDSTNYELEFLKVESGNESLDVISYTSRDLAQLQEGPAAEYFKSRSYKGLEPEILNPDDTNIYQGRSGIASNYERELMDKNSKFVGEINNTENCSNPSNCNCK